MLNALSRRKPAAMIAGFATAAVLAAGLAPAANAALPANLERWGTSITTYQCPSALPTNLREDTTAKQQLSDCMAALATARSTHKSAPNLSKIAVAKYESTMRSLGPKIIDGERTDKAWAVYRAAVMERELRLMKERLHATDIVIDRTVRDEQMSVCLAATGTAFLLGMAFKGKTKSAMLDGAVDSCLKSLGWAYYNETPVWKAVFGSPNLNMW